MVEALTSEFVFVATNNQERRGNSLISGMTGLKARFSRPIIAMFLDLDRLGRVVCSPSIRVLAMELTVGEAGTLVHVYADSVISDPQGKLLEVLRRVNARLTLP